LDHVCGAVVAEVELVAWFDVLDDVGFSAEGGGLGWVGGAEEGDEGAVEADGHVEGGGVVGDDEFCSGDDCHEEGDGGGADAVGDLWVVFGEFEEGCAVEAFAWASDDDDALDISVFGELLGELGEAFDWPALGRPGGGGGEDGVGLWVFDDDLREFFLAGVEGDVWAGDVGTGGLGEFEHAVNGVEFFGGVDAFVVEEPAEFLGVFEAEAAVCAGCS